MILRYGFYDDHRTGNRIWLSSHNRLAAIADSLGRVILVDCSRNVILRIWKGYRDAQCSFMKIDEKMSKNAERSKRKHVLFLAIYSPKRSTVDIWNVERGKKLVTFPAGQNGQLIQQYSSVTSSASSSSNSMAHKSSSSSTTAFFLNPNDFTIKELAIPFHYALDTSNTKKSKDLHIINQIKADLKSVKDGNLTEITDLCESIQTNEMKFKCIQNIIKNRYLTPEIFTMILSTFMKSVEDKDSDISASNNETLVTKLDNGSDNACSDLKLKRFLQKYERLLLFYNGMKQKRSHDDDNNGDDIEIDESDFKEILKVVDRYKMCLNLKKTTKVSIQSPMQSNNFIEYLSIFDCTSTENIRLHESKVNRFAVVGFDLFDTFIKQNSGFDGFYKLATISTLSNWDLLRLFIRYWMEKDIRYNDK